MSATATAAAEQGGGDGVAETDASAPIADICLEDLCDGRNDRGTIPLAKFVDDIDAFANSFRPVPASAELLIGAYNELHAKYKHMESALLHKANRLSGKIPELEKSLQLVRHLQQLQQQQQQEGGAAAMVRYELADSVYGRAAVDPRDGIVHLWLGANVMLEYTYEEAADFLETNRSNAERDLKILKDELGLVRDQIVTAEVNMSRTYNWDVRKRRERQQSQTQSQQAPAPQPAPPPPSGAS